MIYDFLKYLGIPIKPLSFFETHVIDRIDLKINDKIINTDTLDSLSDEQFTEIEKALIERNFTQVVIMKKREFNIKGLDNAKSL